jgi:hypothetical protein
VNAEVIMISSYNTLCSADCVESIELLLNILNVLSRKLSTWSRYFCDLTHFVDADTGVIH